MMALIVCRPPFDGWAAKINSFLWMLTAVGGYAVTDEIGITVGLAVSIFSYSRYAYKRYTG